MREGDIIKGDTGGTTFVVGPMLAYRGKQGCWDMSCSRYPGIVDSCFGWHCAKCDAPCSSQGHFGCPGQRETA